VGVLLMGGGSTAGPLLVFTSPLSQLHSVPCCSDFGLDSLSDKDLMAIKVIVKATNYVKACVVSSGVPCTMPGSVGLVSRGRGGGF